MPNRYNTISNEEGQYEPGSGEKVLLNKTHIIDPLEMDDLELDLLDQVTDEVLSEVRNDQMMTAADIVEWHRKWLGNVYEWAGKYRSVNLGKDSFTFAASTRVPYLMNVWDQKNLAVFTPCNQMGREKLIEAIAVVHVELILIHPFREGNGRIARLLANVMALQADKPELDFTSWDRDRDGYILAIHAGMANSYEPAKDLVKQALLDAGKGVSSD